MAAVCLITCALCAVAQGAPPPPPITAAAAIVVDARDGRELWSWNADRRMYPASLTKIMTGALACKDGQLDSQYTVTQRAASVPETGIGLQQGEKLPLRDLVRAALVWSANDAALAVGEAVSGDVDSFVDRMNEQAREWGCTNTHFCNPHGLHDPEHYSTARDLALISTQAMKLPVFRRTVALRSIQMTRPTVVMAQGPGGQAGDESPQQTVRYERRLLTNRNRLLLSWIECDGIKSGYTKQAGRCLVASASRGGWRALVVVLNAVECTEDCHRLLKWALDNFENRPIVKPGQRDWTARVADGQRAEVPVVAAAGVHALAPVDRTLQAQLRPTIMQVRAPVQRGQVVGRLQVTVGGRVCGEAPLVAAEDIPLSLWGEIKQGTVPEPVGRGLLLVAAGVLLLGTAAKATGARRTRLAPGRGGADRPGPRVRGRRGGDPARDEGGPDPAGDRP
jgi:D-alanyl-D-alanine carboxypeptidase (penicillin-binding protein 5/6)